MFTLQIIPCNYVHHFFSLLLFFSLPSFSESRGSSLPPRGKNYVGVIGSYISYNMEQTTLFLVTLQLFFLLNVVSPLNK
ncbi:hypothetical protein BDC45DRAFT_519814 [Circinella umbellata]|nr:hypothetical protein BDC45DRAFT_519814 [Circinella umbellata]